MFEFVRRLRASLFWWVFPILTISYFGFDSWWFAGFAALSLALWFMLWVIDWVIFKIFEDWNNRDMRMIIHRRRHDYLKRGQVGPPRIDRTEERGGYGV